MWPDWAGDTVVIAAAGPSITQEQVDHARSKARVVAINESWRLAPWADALYACDWQWWLERAPLGEDFAGLRIIGRKPSAGDRVGLSPAERTVADLLLHADVRVGPEMVWDGPHIACGGNGAFQAVNLFARYSGVRRFVLLGVDCHSPGNHWHGRHTHRRAKHTNELGIKGWIRSWENAARDLPGRGVEVINCSPGSALTCFPILDMRDVL